MGATASLHPAVFSMAKEEYEIKKAEGLNDEDLFNHMKTFIVTKTAEVENAGKEGTVGTQEVATPVASAEGLDMSVAAI
jgi:hypothetical protein